MLSFRENIYYFFLLHVAPFRATFIHVLKSMISILVLAVLLETFVFNFRYFTTANLNTIDLHNRIDLSEDSEGYFLLTSIDHELEFSNLNTEVQNVRIDFDQEQPAQNLDIKIQFTDEAHKTYFDTTEYTVGIPVTQIATNSSRSEYVSLNASGLVSSLKIEITSEDVMYPITLESVYINAHYPFRFNVDRFLGVAFILALVYVFRPKSSIYRLKISEEPVKSKVGIIAAVAIECVLISSFLFFGSNNVGVATSSYNFGSWDGHSLVNTFEVGGDSAQQYAELAKSFAKGQLYLDEVPPDWLQEMDDPYDKGARDQVQKEHAEGYLFDAAYYDGHYYVYFGVVPVLIFYLPYYLICGNPFPTAIGVLIAILAFIVGSAALLDRFARYHFKRVSLGLYLLLQIALIAGCGLLYLVKFPTFYSLPIACGLAFSVWGLYFWMRGRTSKHKKLSFFVGSLCMALVLGCRPQLVLLSTLAFPIFWGPYITKGRIKSREGIAEFVCLLIPYIVVIVGIMFYNYARFGSFFDFGANYNLTVNDMTKRGWNIGRIAPAAFAYFIQSPNMCGIFPFLQPTDFATTYMGQTIKEVTYGGILACYPILWILFFAKPIISLRNSQRSTKTITGVILVLVISGILVAIMDAEMAGILQRYYADFSFMFFAAVVLLAFIVNENLPDEPYVIHKSSMSLRRRGRVQAKNNGISSLKEIALRPLLLKVLIAMVALSVIYSGLLCLTPETGWYSSIYSWAYQDYLQMYRFWT